MTAASSTRPHLNSGVDENGAGLSERVMVEDDNVPGFERDFDAIEAAVVETARGRWFLGEFARRNRVADTEVLLEAIGRLGEAIAERPAEVVDPALRQDLGAVADAIERVRADLAESAGPETIPAGASRIAEMLARMIGTAETATSDVLDAAERIQEAAWTLRDAGGDPAVCDELDRRAAQIQTAGACHDHSARRARALIGALRTIEDRVDRMRRRVLGRTGPAAPQPDRPPPERSPEDLAFASARPPDAPRVTPADPPIAPDAAPARNTRHQPEQGHEASPPAPSDPPVAAGEARSIPAALAAIEAIEFRERLKLFT